MKIAYFHTNTIRSSWTIWNAANTMRGLGHEVIDAPLGAARAWDQMLHA